MAKLDPERAERLAAALRDNLKRRKAQARDVSDCGRPREGGGPAALAQEGEAHPPSRE